MFQAAENIHQNMNRQPGSPQTSKYDVKHLATFNVGKSLSAEDGVKKLKALESSNGINLLDCELLIDRKYLSIIDKQTKVYCIVWPCIVLKNVSFHFLELFRSMKLK